MILSFIGIIIYLIKNNHKDISFIIISLLSIFIIESYFLTHITTISILENFLGSRFFINVTIFFIFGIAILLNRLNRKKLFNFIIIFGVICILFNLSLNILYEINEISVSFYYDIDYPTILQKVREKTILSIPFSFAENTNWNNQKIISHFIDLNLIKSIKSLLLIIIFLIISIITSRILLKDKIK